jgi:hypothetical protein
VIGVSWSLHLASLRNFQGQGMIAPGRRKDTKNCDLHTPTITLVRVYNIECCPIGAVSGEAAIAPVDNRSPMESPNLRSLTGPSIPRRHPAYAKQFRKFRFKTYLCDQFESDIFSSNMEFWGMATNIFPNGSSLGMFCLLPRNSCIFEKSNKTTWWDRIFHTEFGLELPAGANRSLFQLILACHERSSVKHYIWNDLPRRSNISISSSLSTQGSLKIIYSISYCAKKKWINVKLQRYSSSASAVSLWPDFQRA